MKKIYTDGKKVIVMTPLEEKPCVMSDLIAAHEVLSIDQVLKEKMKNANFTRLQQ